MMKYRCGITYWRNRWAVFAAEPGYSPGTVLHEFDLLDCAPRNVEADYAFNAAWAFMLDIELPFGGDEIYHMLTLTVSGWTLWQYSEIAETAGENPWAVSDYYLRE